jgi:predicted thioesterase
MIKHVGAASRSTLSEESLNCLNSWQHYCCRHKSAPDKPGYDTVGTHVNVAHLGASPIGMSVTFTAEVIRVDGRRVEFRVEARDEKEKIGEGTHERAIINIAKFATRLAEKKR